MGYNYEKMLGDIKNITEHSAAHSFHIGKSLVGRNIMCVKIGAGQKKLLAAGAFHGLEYLTAAFLVKFARELSLAADAGKEFFGRRAAPLCANVSIYIVPMVNPDGVEIAVNGDEEIRGVWQANARGVDINHNFDADWDKVTDGPAPSKYGGEYPHSEPETKAIADFVRREQFDMVLAFHSQGEEIYYDFNGKTGKRSLEIAEKMAEESGYKVCAPEGTAAFGGFKDWFIDKLGREGFTIEMGRGQNPLPISMMNDVYDKNSKIILRVMEEILK